MARHLQRSYVIIIIATAILLPITDAATLLNIKDAGAGTGHRIKQRNHRQQQQRINGRQMMCGKRTHEFAETRNTTYDSGDTYYGEINDEGQRHGKGIYRWLSGETYQGEWKDDNQHGFGEWKHPDGKISYRGEWYNGTEHGIGIYIRENGDHYEGMFKYGAMHGNGTMKYARSGATYTGGYVNNQKSGFGIYVWKSGETYHGEWKHDERNGEGIQRSKWSIYTYRGPWRDDKKHGWGIETWYGTFLVCEGEWNDGKPPPRGKCICRLESLQRFVQSIWNELVDHYMMIIILFGFWLVRNQKPWAFMRKEPSFQSFVGQKKSKDLVDIEVVVELDQDYILCGICYEAFTSDMNSTNPRTREMLPVMGSCGHYFCHGCTIRWKDTVAGRNCACPKCMKANQFDFLNPIYHRMLIDLLQRARPVEK